MAGYPPQAAPYPPQNVSSYPTHNTTSACVSKIELHISCKGLHKMDITSSSDPMAVLHMLDKQSKQWVEVSVYYVLA